VWQLERCRQDQFQNIKDHLPFNLNQSSKLTAFELIDELLVCIF
jgi:hypothetical protein